MNHFGIGLDGALNVFGLFEDTVIRTLRGERAGRIINFRERQKRTSRWVRRESQARLKSGKKLGAELASFPLND